MDAPDRAVDAAVNAQREAVAGAVDGLDDLIQAVGGVGDHMKDGPEHLALQHIQAVDPIDAGGEKGAVGAGLGQGRPAQQAAVAVHAPPVGLEHGQGVGVDHRPHVRRKQRRVAHRQLGGGADQHIDDAPGGVVLQEHHAQRRAPLAGAQEGRGYGVRHHLLGQGRGIDDHHVLAAGLGDQRDDGAGAGGQGLVDQPRGVHRAGEGDPRNAGIGDQGRAHRRSVAGQQMQHRAGHPRPVQNVDRAGGDQRGLPGRLGDHGVARRQRRAHLAHEDGEREVPRADAGEHAAPVQGQFVAFAGGPGQGLRLGEVGAAPEGVVAAEIDRLAHLGQGVGDLVGMLHGDAVGAHGLGDPGEARVLQVGADVAVVVEVHLVLLLGPPLAVVEHHRGHRDVLAHAGQGLAEAHAPGAVAHIGDGRAPRFRHLGADGRGEGVAAVAEAHGGEEALRLFEAQIAVGHRTDVADVGGHHGVLGQRLLQFAQGAARRDRRAVGGGKRIQLLFPGVLAAVHLGHAGVAVAVGGDGHVLRLDAFQDRHRRALGVAEDGHRYLLDQAEHAVVAVHLDDLGVLRPVLHAVLGQGAEGPEAGAERQHHVGLGDHVHRRFRALVAQGPAHQRVAGREGVVVQVAGHHRRRQVLGQGLGRLDAIRHDDPAAGQDDREFRLGQGLRRRRQALGPAGAALDLLGLGDVDVDVAVEMVARDVDLHRAAFGERQVEGAAGQLGDAPGAGHMGLELGDLGEDRQLLGLLETAEADGGAAGLRRDADDRRMGPVGGGDGGDEVGDPGAVLADAHAVAVAHPRVPVRHVPRALLVGDGDKADSRRLEDIERVHVGGTDDPEDIGDALGDQGLDESLARRHAGHGDFLPIVFRGPPGAAGGGTV